MIRVFRQYISLRRWLLFVVQSFLIVLCAYLAAAIRFLPETETFRSYISLPGFGFKLISLVAGIQIGLLVSRDYDTNQGSLWTTSWVDQGRALGSAGILLGSLYFVVPSLLVGRGVFFIAILLVALATGASEAAFRKTWFFTKPQNILVIGTGELASIVAQNLKRRTDLGLHLVGFVAEEPSTRTLIEPGLRRQIVGEIHEIERLVQTLRIGRIVVAMQERRGGFPSAALVRVKVSGVVIEEAHVTLACLTGHLWLRAVRPSSFVYSDGFRRSPVTMAMKRTLDLGLAITGFIVAFPIMFVLFIAIRLESPGSAIYKQTRVGRQGHGFELLKFRSMRSDAERHGAQWAVTNDPRVTHIGKFIRKYRLDELPQFLNIIRGEMSFVGPRPERPWFVEQLRERIAYYDERHSVRPGLTGWAQVRYGYGASVNDATRKLEYDLFYLQNMSIFFDCAIVLSTIRTVLNGFERRKTPEIYEASCSSDFGTEHKEAALEPAPR